MDGFNDYLDHAVRVAYDELAMFAKQTISLTECRSHFLSAEYFNILEKFLEHSRGDECHVRSQPSSEANSFDFQAKIKFEDIPDEEKRAEARQIVKRVRAEHVPVIEKRLEEQFDRNIVQQMPWASKGL